MRYQRTITSFVSACVFAIFNNILERYLVYYCYLIDIFSQEVYDD